ncbi:MAG: hypothetical protein M5U13_13605 [Thermoanaerobaculia bacterium]|nr:hypothetical protein [Thermoanaerobaculia bacterium]
MFQPKVKLEFVRRYLSPAAGWTVFVDIDASEEGRTGGERTTPAARERQERMRVEGAKAREGLRALGVTVGGKRAAWFKVNQLPVISGDHDIVGFHRQSRLLVLAEVEGESTGQPEQKAYKAVGQILRAASQQEPPDWERQLVVVVSGEEIRRHLGAMAVLTKLGISGVAIDAGGSPDVWVFGERPDKVAPSR